MFLIYITYVIHIYFKFKTSLQFIDYINHGITTKNLINYKYLFYVKDSIVSKKSLYK